MSKAKDIPKIQQEFQQALINMYSSKFDAIADSGSGIGDTGLVGLGIVAVAGAVGVAATLMATNPQQVFAGYKDLTPVEKATILSQPIGTKGNTALHIAAEAGDLSMVQWLVKNGANLEARNTANVKAEQLSSNTTFESVAATRRRMAGGSPQDSRIQQYLKDQAKKDAAEFKRANSIITSASSIPIQHGVIIASPSAKIPITQALPTNSLEAKRMKFIELLTAQPDKTKEHWQKTRSDTINSALEDMTPAEKIYTLSKPNEGGNTPLHLVAFRKDLDLVKVFVKHGANIYTLNKAGNTPEKLTDGAVAEYLQEASAKITSFMKSAQEGENAEILEALKESPWLLEAKNEHGGTASNIASDNMQYSTVKLLTAEKARSSTDDEDLSQYAPTVLTGEGKDDDDENKIITYGNYPGIENLNFSDTALVGEALPKNADGNAQKRFGNAAEGGTVLETYDEKKGFQYKIEPKDTDPPGKVYKIEVPRMGDDGKIIPGEVDTLVFNRDGELLEYKAPDPSVGTCRLDEEWLEGLQAARSTALSSKTKMTTLDGTEESASRAMAEELDTSSLTSMPQPKKIFTPTKPLSVEERAQAEAEGRKAHEILNKGVIKQIGQAKEHHTKLNQAAATIKKSAKVMKHLRAFKRSTTVENGTSNLRPDSGLPIKKVITEIQ